MSKELSVTDFHVFRICDTEYSYHNLPFSHLLSNPSKCLDFQMSEGVFTMERLIIRLPLRQTPNSEHFGTL